MIGESTSTTEQDQNEVRSYASTSSDETLDSQRERELWIEQGKLLQDIHPSIANAFSDLVENAISKSLDSEVDNLSDIDASVWKIEAYKISKKLLCKYQTKIEQDLKQLLGDEREKFANFPPPNENEKCDTSSEISNMAMKYFDETKESMIELKACADLAERIGGENNLETRMKHLNLFLQLQTCNDIDANSWTEIFKKLKKNLTDESAEIFSVTIQIHLKLAFYNHFLYIKESVRNLVESSYHQYHFKKFPNLEINSKETISERTINIFLCLLEILKHVEQNISRMNEKLLREILGSFIGLMFVHPSNLTDIKQIYKTETLCPFAFLAALDPNASWLRILLFNAKSRQVTLDIFTENRKFLQHKVSYIYDWFQQSDKEIPLPSERQSIKSGLVKFLTVKYGMFIHSMSILSNLCQCVAGKKMILEICNESELISYESLLMTMINFLNQFEEYQKTKSIEFSETLIELVITTILSLIPNEDTEFLSLIFPNIFSPLRDDQGISQTYMDFLSRLLDNLGRIKFLVKHSRQYYFPFDRQTNTPNSSKTNSSRSKRSSTDSERRTARVNKPNDAPENTSMVRIIFEYAQKLLNTLTSEDSSTVFSLMNIMSKLCDYSDTLILASSYLTSLVNNVLQFIVDDIHNLNQTNLDAVTKDKEKKSKEEKPVLMRRAIRNLLLSIFCSPIGMPLLAKTDSLEDIIYKDFLVVSSNQWNHSTLKLFVSFALHFNQSLMALVQNNYFTIRPFQNLLESEAFYEPHFSKPVTAILEAFMNVSFITSLSSKALKELLSQTNESALHNWTQISEDDLKLINVLYIIPCNLFYSSDNQNIFHFIALSALRILFQNVNSCICLLLHFNLQERLTDESFATNSLKKSKEVIIDECNILRSELINLSYSPGIYKNEKDMGLTQFCTEVITPNQKLKTATHRKRQLNEINKFLFSTKKGLHDLGWHKLLRKSFQNSLKDEIKCSLVLEVVEQVSKCGGCLAGKSIQWSLLEKKYPSKLSQFDDLALTFTLRYGEKNYLLQENTANRDNFIQFFNQIKTYFSQLQESSVQFDWFSATIFLLCSGNPERSLQILSFLSAIPSTDYVWLHLAQKRGQLWNMLGQLIEWLLSIEQPKIYSLFKIKGISWWLVYRSWMEQCFWNQLPWNEILHWILLTILYPIDYQIYFSISILKHSHDQLLLSDMNGNFLDTVLTVMHNYQLDAQMSFIASLHKKYSSYLIHTLQFCPDYG